MARLDDRGSGARKIKLERHLDANAALARDQLGTSSRKRKTRPRAPGLARGRGPAQP